MKSNTTYLALFCFLLASCTTQPGKVEFRLDEIEYKKPKVVNASPTIRQIPDSLPNAKYTTEKGQLVTRDHSIPLKIVTKKKAGKPKITEKRLKKRKIPTNLKKRLAGTPKKVKARGKTIPARGKVVMAGKPISKPYMVPVVRDQDNYGFRNISQDQNLPGTNGYALLEDSHGRIWIGTDNGLVILEGGEMKIYTTQEGLSSNGVFSLLESSTGAIWIGTDAGVDVFKEGLFLHYGTEEGLSGNRVYTLLESSTGAIWIGTFRGGVDVFESGNFTHYGIEEGLSSNRIRSLLESSTGAIWIGTYGGGVDIYESDSFTHYGTEEGLSGNRIYSLLESSTGAIWIGTSGKGVDVFESGSFTHYGIDEGLSGNTVYSLLESSTGAIWLSIYRGGVDVFESGSFLHYGTEEGLSSNRVNRLLESSTGAIWIGTAGGGVDVFESDIFTHYGTQEGLSNNFIRSLLEASTGAIWIGNEGGLDVFKSGSFTHYGVDEGLSSNRVRSLLESSTGAIWIGTSGGGVDVFESGSFAHYGTEEGLSSDFVVSLLESATGAIWIGTSEGGVDVFESGSFTHYGREEGLSDNRVRSLLESSTGAIWIGSYGGGVDVFESGSFTHYGTEEGLSSNRVYSLLESAIGSIWIGTIGGGVDVFESGGFTHYSTQEGLADNAVTQLAMDNLGNIWAGTGKGMTRFVAKEEGYELTSWNKSHGLKYMDFNGPGNPMLFTKTDKVSKKGTMWSGIGGVLTVFEPPLADTLKPTLFFTGIDIWQKPIDWSRISDVEEKIKTMKGIKPDTLFFPDSDSVLLLDNLPSESNSLTTAGIRWSGVEDLAPYHLPLNLELPHNQNHLTFHYSGMKLKEQFDVVYRYILEGMDKSWSPFSQEGKADYRNIPPGQYTFRVRARGRNLLWSDETSISFLVHPPWWLTWWAKTLWTGFVLGFFFAIYKVSIRALKLQKKKLEFQVEEQTLELKEQNVEISLKKDELEVLNQEKNKLIGMVAHDLRSPLNSVKGLIYITRTEKDKAVKERFMEMIATSTDRMTDMVNRILDVSALEAKTLNLRMEKVDLVVLINQRMINFRMNAETKKQQVELILNCDSATIEIDKNYFIQVLENLMSNAIKYSEHATDIKISLEFNAEQLKLTVQDQGQGISEEEQKNLFKEFTTLSSKTTDGEKATGLGLSIVKKYVEAMNGKIWCESELGVGSKFILQFKTP
jgi:signal transduction histidine kinase/ligand-binding sensor domain-containing protein